MTLWGNREWYGQGQQKTEKVGGGGGGTGEGLLTAINGHSLESNRTVSLSLLRLDCGCTSSDRVDCGSKDCLAS